ncbi:hypothetical protein ARMGADRAFT_1033439 [Armillaria gallica]|uniref:Uncharacterized protein n=1 Tax=Armillaria gallica TaxID=47427 RepID=A0A2H3DPM2_ARMGA|nr:hypothetical protein ARMGADRAFT_1033439 [Armillaria gallica]
MDGIASVPLDYAKYKRLELVTSGDSRISRELPLQTRKGLNCKDTSLEIGNETEYYQEIKRDPEYAESEERCSAYSTAGLLVYILGPEVIALHLQLLSIPSGRISAGDLDCLVNVIESRRKKDVDSSNGQHCTLLEKVILGPEPIEFDEEELSERWLALLAGGLIITHRKRSNMQRSKSSIASYINPHLGYQDRERWE